MFVYNDVTYTVGDFVYVEPREAGLEHHIVVIEKLWKNTSSELMLSGTFFLKPQETFHHATRKFLQRVSHCRRRCPRMRRRRRTVRVFSHTA